MLEAEFSEAARERAKTLVTSFEQFIRDNKDEITALQVLYSRPYAKRLTFPDIKELAEALKTPPRSWLPEKLWRAYETLDQAKVRGSGGTMLTDIVSLVRFALHQEDELVPFADEVELRFQRWLAMQEVAGASSRTNSAGGWNCIRDQIASGLRVERDDFEDTPFVQRGGLGKAYRVFGEELATAAR